MKSLVRALIALAFTAATIAAVHADGIGVFENIFGGIGNFGLSGQRPAPPKPIGCAGTGFNFTLACNSQYIAAF